MTFDDSEEEDDLNFSIENEFDDLDGNQEDEFFFDEEDDFEEEEEDTSSPFDEYDDDNHLSYDDVFKEEEDYDEPYDDHEAEDGYGSVRRNNRDSYFDDYE